MPCTKRDLVRARAMARQVLAKARQHLQGLLLHHIGFGGSRLDDGLSAPAGHGALRATGAADRAATGVRGRNGSLGWTPEISLVIGLERTYQ
jgi:hypothetical protein